jgi:hypothetical protein
MSSSETPQPPGTDPNLAWFTEQAATRLQHAADYLRGCSWPQLRDDGARLARNHPVAFFGGLFVLGTLAGAAIKAATPTAADANDDDQANVGDPSFAARDNNSSLGNAQL